MPSHSTGPGISPETMPYRQQRLGVIFAAGGYIFWGVTPIFWKFLDQIPIFEVLLHRIVWAVPFLALWLLVRGRLFSAFAIINSAKTCLMLVTSALLMSVNWGIFIWAVSQNRIMDASFGYYINPLMSVVIAALLLGEKLSRGQAIAIGLASIAIILQIWNLGSLPWISLSLALTFSFYGFFKKKMAHVGAAQGLFVEVILILPFALVGIAWLIFNSQNHFQTDGSSNWILLILAGLVTVVPLVLFAAGARRITLITIGLLQYIAPSISLLVAVFIYKEAAEMVQILSFGLIWAGLAVFSYDAYQSQRI